MTKTPRPGARVRGSSTGVPIMAAFDLLGRRWAMRILWELGRGPCSFRELRERCSQLPPASLNARLKDLRADLIVTLDDKGGGYRLTAIGEELNHALNPLRDWSKRWSEQIAIPSASAPQSQAAEPADESRRGGRPSLEP